jgi:hypothetical protein
MQEHSSTFSHRIASRRVQRCIALLACASTELHRASGAANDTYSRDRLKNLANGLRDVGVPLSRIASHLERGECL